MHYELKKEDSETEDLLYLLVAPTGIEPVFHA